MALFHNATGASLRPRHVSRHSTYIASGTDLFYRFCEHTGLHTVDSISFFDHHNVVDTIMDERTAVTLGVDLSYLDDHGSVLLSYSGKGSPHRPNAFDDHNVFFPMINEMDGFIFTDLRERERAAVHVYQEDWMETFSHDDKGRLKCDIVCVEGDKGQAAELFEVPSIMFDDQENNVRKVMLAGPRNAGCVVRIGHVNDRRRSLDMRTRFDRDFFVAECHDDLFTFSRVFRDRVQERLGKTLFVLSFFSFVTVSVFWSLMCMKLN